MAWHQISMVSDEKFATDISDFLTECGAVSVTYMAADSQAIYEPPIGETKIWSHTKIIALFERDKAIDAVHEQLLQHFSADTVQDWSVEILADQLWERTWLAHYKPLCFGQRLNIYPSGHAPEDTTAINLILDPGLAFGTGTHATTALCLTWLAEHDIQDKTVIDFGCGSGILAVAALLLGAKTVHAVDIDPQALIATRDNAEKNNVTTQLHTYLAEDFHAAAADILLANILAQPLLQLEKQLSRLVKKDGHIILSGILLEQATQIVDGYKAHFNLNPVKINTEWCCIDGVKL